MSERVTFDPPREITFEEIRKGDEIEVQEPYDGLLKSVRAIAHHRVDFQRTTQWYTATDRRLVSSDDLDYQTHLLLHSRLASDEPTGLGAVVRARTSDDEEPHLWVRVDRGTDGRAWVRSELKSGGWHFWVAWPYFVPDSVEVLHEGVEA